MNSPEQFIEVASQLRNQNRSAEAAGLYQQAAQISRQENRLAQVAEAEHMQAVCWVMEADYDKAQAAFSEALSLYDSLGDNFNRGRVLRDQAIMLQSQGDNSAALELLAESITELEKPSQADIRLAQAEIGISYIKLGMTKTHLDQFAGAKLALTKGIEMVRAAGQSFYLATGMLHLAELNIAQQEFVQAQQTLTAAEQILLQQPLDQNSRRLAQVIGLKAYVLSLQDPTASEEIREAYGQALKLLEGSTRAARGKVLEDIHADQIQRVLSAVT